MIETPPPLTGHDLIADYLMRLDGSPGVYRMLDSENRVLYVGKARNLKIRVASYARPQGHSARISRMINETSSMMFLTTKTETCLFIHISEPTRLLSISYAVFCLKKKTEPTRLRRISYAVFCLKKTTTHTTQT